MIDKPARLDPRTGKLIQEEPAVVEPVYTFHPQPYPLFIADWNRGKPIVGRIIGWDTAPGRPPIPVVVYEHDGQTWLPMRASMKTGMVKSGPLWIRDTAAEATQAAAAYVPPTEAA